MLTLSQAAQELGLSPDTLRSQIRYGSLKATKVGPVWTISKAELARYRERSLGRRGPRKD